MSNLHENVTVPAAAWFDVLKESESTENYKGLESDWKWILLMIEIAEFHARPHYLDKDRWIKRVWYIFKVLLPHLKIWAMFYSPRYSVENSGPRNVLLDFYKLHNYYVAKYYFILKLLFFFCFEAEFSNHPLIASHLFCSSSVFHLIQVLTSALMSYSK